MKLTSLALPLKDSELEQIYRRWYWLWTTSSSPQIESVPVYFCGSVLVRQYQ